MDDENMKEEKENSGLRIFGHPYCGEPSSRDIETLVSSRESTLR